MAAQEPTDRDAARVTAARVGRGASLGAYQRRSPRPAGKARSPNEIAGRAAALPPWRLAKLWAPVPWMLEAAIVLQLALHEYLEAAVVGGLLIFNAALGFFQEGRAQATLAALKSRLALNASVRRDGAWALVPARGLVPGDLVKLSLGAVVAADVTLVEGSVLLDQSMLTGESIPIEAGPGVRTFAGALVRRGEATALVTATGAGTKFGRTAELVRTAHVESTQEKTVVRVVRNLAIFNGGAIACLLAYACARTACRSARSSRWCSPPCWRRSRWLCPPPSPWPRLWARRPWRAWGCCPRGCRRWTRRPRWMSCARTRPGP